MIELNIKEGKKMRKRNPRTVIIGLDNFSANNHIT